MDIPRNIERYEYMNLNKSFLFNLSINSKITFLNLNP